MKFKIGDLVVLKDTKLKGVIMSYYISGANLPCYFVLWDNKVFPYAYVEGALELIKKKPVGHKLTKIFK